MVKASDLELEGSEFRMLTIFTNHPGGNLVHKHKTRKFDVLGE